MLPLDWPLMQNNIVRSDLDGLIAYLQQPEPMLTQAAQVRGFEAEWSAWLGTKHSVFVNSGASANVITMAALKHFRGQGEVIVPPLTWVSDIASVLHAGMEPVFVDINPKTLALDTDQVLERLTSRTRAVFLTHILGYNGLNQRLLDELKSRNICLIEDVCESHGATFKGRKLGSLGWASNFSFYYAHHLSTIEGGMICTDDEEFMQVCRVMRSHGMTRESTSEVFKSGYKEKYPDLSPDFIFAFPSHNMRSTELNAVIGRNQLPRLDANNVLRNRNMQLFLGGLDSGRFFTEFETEGASSYAFTLVLRDADFSLRDRVETTLRQLRVEFRRGTSGGGNQLRQPYLRERFPNVRPEDFPKVDHIHFFGWYIGNYPDLDPSKIVRLTEVLNSL